MNSLTYNPIAGMYGPDFLLFYGSAIGIILTVVILKLRDSTASQPLQPVPQHPNPYLVAYLRGTRENVLTLAGFSLVQEGYLEVRGKALRQACNPPDSSSLNTLEKSVFDFFKKAKLARRIFDEPSLQSQCSTYQQILENQQLLRNSQDITTVSKVKLTAISLILGLGAYQFTIVLSNGYRNAGYLIFMAFLAVLILLNICDDASKRLTRKGQNYLKQLQAVSRKLNFEQSDENARFLLAMFGINLLADTRYQNYFQAMTLVRTPSRKTELSSSSDSDSAEIEYHIHVSSENERLPNDSFL